MGNLITEDKKKELSRLIKRSASTNEGKYYVLPSKGRWGVMKEGTERFLKLFVTKKSAIKSARLWANKNGNKVIIVLNNDGRISTIE